MSDRAREQIHSSIAIDVVLRPDRKTDDLSIRLSESLPADRPFTLNRTDRFPHVSVFMAHMAMRDLEKARERLANIADQYQIIPATAEIEFYENEARPILSALKINGSPDLQTIHERIVESLRDLGGQIPTDTSYVLDSEEHAVRQGTIDFTNDYTTNSSFQNFHPHITLGFGRPSMADIHWPIPVRLETLAIFQLGNWNTCRKLLGSWPLKEQA